MNSELPNKDRNEGVRNVGYAYILFSLTFLISIISVLTDISFLSYISILIGFAGLVIVIVSRKSLKHDFRRHLINGISIYILFAIIAILGATIYVVSVAFSIVTEYPSGNIPDGVISSLIVNTVIITVIPSLLYYISYYLLNIQFFKNNKFKLLIAALLASLAFTLIGFIGEMATVFATLSSITTLSSAESAINLIKAHSINLYSLFSILSAIILLVLFFYSGHELLTNPQNYAKSDNDYGLY
ncbi:MAG: hypothetical protein RE472_08405 [Thermoplasmatales archaeon]|nr:MAG: hypothetical protein AMDU5_GPLC00001G0184 [Thermoplasmatales archaeon Gpl]WMT49082.1 MAG: hypothetical protein RE472_08405 [Thermoplasmatales archaeon]